MAAPRATALCTCLPLAASLFVAMPVRAADSLAQAMAGGDAGIAFRLRYEGVDDDAFAEDADATTLRTRLAYTSGHWHGLQLGVELDHVGLLFSADFNDTRNGRTTRPVVADPDGADLNQAWLAWRGTAFAAVAGRQRINLGNQRFVGGVGWRQNEQTFDALRLTATPSQALSVDYAWVADTRRVFGPEDGTPPASLASDHHLLDLRWSARPAASLGGYAYLLDFEDAPALSSRTVGGYLAGEFKRERIGFGYRLELARQSDHAGNPVDFEAGYHFAGAHLGLGPVRLEAAVERLGADREAGVAVQTPLATLHAFQGWSDKFLSTPAAGIRDLRFGVGGSIAGTRLQAAWHRYRSDIGGLDYGTELDLQASRSFAGRYALTAKFADFRADGFARDTRKVWLMAEAAF